MAVMVGKNLYDWGQRRGECYLISDCSEDKYRALMDAVRQIVWLPLTMSDPS